MKKTRFFFITLALSATMSLTSFAGTWQQDSTGWWYQNDNGSYPVNVWFQDYDGKWFYFNEQGYMLTNGTSPDGRSVGADGSWVLPITGDTKQILNEINRWLILDIWNNGYCDFGHYEYDGKDSTGSDIDIEYAFQIFCENYKKKASYGAFINTLPDEYASLKTAWGKLSTESDKIFAYYNQHGIHQTESETISTDLFQQYQSAFTKYFREIK